MNPTKPIYAMVPALPIPPLDESEGKYTQQQMLDYAFAAMKNQKHFMEITGQALTIPECLHSSTANVITVFFNELAAKLFAAQEKYGLKEGWSVVPNDLQDELGKGRFFINEEHCRTALLKHLEKGDILDCVAYLIYTRALTGSTTMLPIICTE